MRLLAVVIITITEHPPWGFTAGRWGWANVPPDSLPGHAYQTYVEVWRSR